jgi:hypothetical protein
MNIVFFRISETAVTCPRRLAQGEKAQGKIFHRFSRVTH